MDITFNISFLAFLLKSIKSQENEERSLELHGYLIKNYKDSLLSLFYHLIFLIRRLFIAASIHIFQDFPYVQAII